MKKSVLFILYLLGMGTAALAAIGQSVPGYMDADYYYATGIQVANGNGFKEPFLWNYLDNPTDLPHPSHLYWMPLASLLSAAGMIIGGSTSFLAARTPFILLAGMVPVISAGLSTSLLKSRKYYWVAGLLGIFPGLYVIYYSIPETFMLYLVLGGLFWLIILKTNWQTQNNRKIIWAAVLLGVTSGLMHLSRADGIIWAAGGGGWFVYTNTKREKSQKIRIAIISLALFVLSYGVIMGAWYARNLELFGWIMPPGNSRTLWITDYNETFYYPASELTLKNWLEAGAAVHLKAWWTALEMNLKNLLAVQGMVVLAPLMAAGLWVNRQNKGVAFAAYLWLVNFLVMTLVFPYAGARGGFLHSASAFQTLLWAAVPAGLEVFTDWGKRKRDWKPDRAIPVFSTLLILTCALLTGWFYLQKVFGDGSPESRWGYSFQNYGEIAAGLDSYSVDEQDLFMVNNPPGFYLATGYSAIVIPGGGEDQTIEAGAFYGAKYLILEEGQENLSSLYNQPEDIGALQYMGEVSGAHIFCFSCR